MKDAQSILCDLLELCPDFRTRWDCEVALWTDDDGHFTVHGVFAAFSHYIAQRLARECNEGLKKVFEYVESKLTGDDSEVDNAATTCFLENLMNRVPESISPQRLVPLLGPRARWFCRAYNQWCGVETEGL